MFATRNNYTAAWAWARKAYFRASAIQTEEVVGTSIATLQSGVVWRHRRRLGASAESEWWRANRQWSPLNSTMQREASAKTLTPLWTLTPLPATFDLYYFQSQFACVKGSQMSDKACLKLDGNLLAPTNAKKTSQTNTCCISKNNNQSNWLI